MPERTSAFSASASFTPAAAAYGAGDVMSVAQELSGIGGKLGSGLIIMSTTLLVAHTAVISGETSYTLHLYGVTPPSAHADNDAWDLPAGDRAAYLGSLALGTPVDIGSSLYVAVDNINKQIVVPSAIGGGSLWAELVTVGAFTATAAARTVRINGYAV